MTPKMGEDIRYLLAQGLQPLVDAIPVLIREGRLELGDNDIAIACFVDDDGKHTTTYAKNRVLIYNDLKNFIATFEMRNLFLVPPNENHVPVFVHFRGDQFAFIYIIPNTDTAGVLN
jgi:hypothetical protein